jgi:hypothetical protein
MTAAFAQATARAEPDVEVRVCDEDDDDFDGKKVAALAAEWHRSSAKRQKHGEK